MTDGQWKHHDGKAKQYLADSGVESYGSLIRTPVIVDVMDDMF
jgi:hypothetical protein